MSLASILNIDGITSGFTSAGSVTVIVPVSVSVVLVSVRADVSLPSVISGESFVPGSGRLVTLEDVFLETSDHDIDDSAEGAYAVCRVIVEDFGDEDDDEDGTDPEADGEPADGEEGIAAEVAVLCGAVRIVAADGTGVSQQNVYSTKQPGRVDFDEYVRQLATFPNLPIRADVQPLFVCDTHLRLMVAVDTEELTDEHDEDDDEEEDLPDLRAMRTPRRAH